MKDCVICRSKIKPFISFGRMPLANGFILPSETFNEYFYELAVAFCSKCFAVQLMDQPDREKMFHSDYPFFSETSALMGQHFDRLASQILSKNLAGRINPFVVEIGSNDGILLKNFHRAGIRYLGIEPSSGVAEIAKKKGLNTIIDFFDPDLAENVRTQYGFADVIVAANVVCHIPTLPSIFEAVKVLLHSEGFFIFEDPYVGEVIRKTSYDQIYDEHYFLFSLLFVRNLARMHDMELIDAESQETHGGSMRYTLVKKGNLSQSCNTRVDSLIAKELELGLDKEITYTQFMKSCQIHRMRLLELLDRIKSDGKSIVGYAATSKSTTIINYCGITDKYLDYICDTTPVKHGKLSPGAHIPVKPHSEFRRNYPDYALLFAYNHEKEIMEKEKEFTAQGGHWLHYVPTVRTQ